jgi:hypothetical protein
MDTMAPDILRYLVNMASTDSSVTGQEASMTRLPTMPSQQVRLPFVRRCGHKGILLSASLCDAEALELGQTRLNRETFGAGLKYRSTANSCSKTPQ